MSWYGNCKLQLVTYPLPEWLHHSQFLSCIRGLQLCVFVQNVPGDQYLLTFKLLASIMIPPFTSLSALSTQFSLSSPLSLGEDAVINISGCVTGGPPSTSWRAELLMEFRGGRQRASRQGERGSLLGFLQSIPHYWLSITREATHSQSH